MLKSNPYEKITGTIYLSNGQAPSEEEQQQDAGSKKEFESEEVKNFVEDMYKTGLTQEKTLYMIYLLLGDTNNNTGATDFSNMSDEEILKAFEEKQNSENADNKITQKRCQIQKQKQQKIQPIKQIKLRI